MFLRNIADYSRATLERLLAKDPMAGEPARSNGQSSSDDEREKCETELEVIVDLQRKVQEETGTDVGKDEADSRGDQAEHGELDREDGCDARTCGAESLEDDDFADAAKTRACNGTREDDDAREDAERGEELDDVGDLQNRLADNFDGKLRR